MVTNWNQTFVNGQHDSFESEKTLSVEAMK